MSIANRVAAIRQWLQDQQLDALLIPHEDEYLGEYIPAHNERLAWVTGFTGSAGAAVITKDGAAVFVDGRYVVQVRQQAPADVFSYEHLIENPPLNWLLAHLPEGSKVAIDPRLHSQTWFENAQAKVDQQLTLIAIEQNPIDTNWHDRPAATLSSAVIMPESRAGESSDSKRTRLMSKLAEHKAQAVVLTALDSIAWLLNVRGNDVPSLPILLSTAILHDDQRIDWYISPARISDAVRQHLGENVHIHAPETLAQGLIALKDRKVMIDPATSNAWINETLDKAQAQRIPAADPCLLFKAAKNTTEAQGMKDCHRRDGAAMARFLAWLDKEVATGNYHDEATLADQLWAFRQLDPSCLDVSFDTISAAGSNAAMCHYNHNNQEKPGVLTANSLYLVDSGAQYPDGTTDITRTITIGQPSDEMKKLFTLVLKGHIALAGARFAKGTSGSQLDALARQHLWAHGYDFDHGTGHGVGHHLSVHEGPQRISKAPNTVALLPGMVLSNEPGYYRADAFGIRIENLELVTEIATQGDMSVLGFQSLTRTPIDVRAMDLSLMTDSEIAWVNQYHQTVWDEVSPLLNDDQETQTWLKQATQAIER